MGDRLPAKNSRRNRVEILNLGGAPDNNSSAPKAGKRLRVLLGIGALAAATGIGSTLAANISLNGGNDVEFGQGVVTTAACSDAITVTPVTSFVNVASPGTSYFELDRIDLSNVDSDCTGKYFLIRAYNNTDGSSPLNVFNGAGGFATTAITVDGEGDVSVELPGGDSVESVFKFTIESFDTAPAV
jgi:hypothetical protein